MRANMANADKTLTVILATLVIIIIIIVASSILLPIYFGNADLIPSVFAQDSSEEDDVYSLYSIGIQAYEQGMYEQAIEYFDRVLTIDVNHVNALTMKGIILNAQGYYEEAIQYFDRALAINPNDIFALNNKGLALGTLGRYEEAIGYFDQIIEYFKGPLNQESSISEVSNNKEDYFVTLVATTTTTTTIIIPNGNYFDENLLLLLAVLQAHPNLKLENTLFNNLEGEYKGSPELHYITSFLTSSEAITAEFNKGRTLFDAQNYQEALELFDQILANDEGHIDSLYYKGQCLERLGFQDEAEVYSNRVNQTDPNYEPPGIIKATSPLVQAVSAPFQQLLVPVGDVFGDLLSN